MAHGDSETITKRSLESQATDRIRDRIVTGDLALGERLVETPLAEHYGLSRGTIRAALRRLVEEGLVQQTPYAGYRVIELNAQDLWEVYTLRATLERLAARLAAERVDAPAATALRTAFDELMQAARAGDHVAANRCDHALHLLIVRLAGHQRLAQHYARIENQFRAYISLSNRAATSREIAESHRELVDHICAGDAAAAERLAAANIHPPLVS